MNAGDKSTLNKRDVVIADTYRNKFIILLDFEMLDSMMPYYQSELLNRLCYEITFKDYDLVIKSSKSCTKYKISDVSLECEIVNQPDLGRHIVMEYQSLALLYDRILRDRQIPVNKSDTVVWNWLLNTTCKSLKGILILFEEEAKPYL